MGQEDRHTNVPSRSQKSATGRCQYSFSPHLDRRLHDCSKSSIVLSQEFAHQPTVWIGCGRLSVNASTKLVRYVVVLNRNSGTSTRRSRTCRGSYVSQKASKTHRGPRVPGGFCILILIVFHNLYHFLSFSL